MRSPIDVATDFSAGRPIAIEWNSVSDGYFELLRIPVLAGRGVQVTDDSRSEPVVVLTQAAANLLWPGQSPIGRTLEFAANRAAGRLWVWWGTCATALWGNRRPPSLWHSSPFRNVSQMWSVSRCGPPGEPAAFAGALRRIIARCAADMPVSDVQPLEKRVEEGLSQVRVVSLASGVVAGGCGARTRRNICGGRLPRSPESARDRNPARHRCRATDHYPVVYPARPASWTFRVRCRADARPVVRNAAALRTARCAGAHPWLIGGAAGLLVFFSGVVSWAVARRVARFHPSEVLRTQ